MNSTCPLCRSAEIKALPEQPRDQRQYFFCTRCEYIFVSRTNLLEPEKEKSLYKRHENDPNDPRYRQFLSRLTVPLSQALDEQKREKQIEDHPFALGLDYGCGPGPTISVMLNELGYDVANYDPLFFPDSQVLQTQYDFITCTEAAEHFNDPLNDWMKLDRLLKPGGYLAVMTQLYDDHFRDLQFLSDDARDNFSSWYYTRDLTHVGFYNRQSMLWLAEHFSYQCRFYPQSVMIFTKKSASENL